MTDPIPVTPQPEPTPLALTVPQAARACGIGERLLWKFIALREIEVCRLGRRSVIRVEALDQFLRDHAVATDGPAPVTRAPATRKTASPRLTGGRRVRVVAR